MSLINDFLSLIYPRLCQACTISLFKHENHLCNHCLTGLPRGSNQGQNNTELTNVFAGRVPFNHIMALYRYEKSGKVQRVLHAIKYQGQKELAVFLGKNFAKELMDVGLVFDEIIPIPLHKNKLKKRGYNQSEYFARGIAEGLKVHLNNHSMERIVETSTQTNKKKYQRWENVEGIFSLKETDLLKNKHVLLVDDVITTGATIEAAWQVLQNVEGIKVSIASIAFAARGFA